MFATTFVQHEPNHHVVNVCHLEAQVGSTLDLSTLVFVVVLQLRRWGTFMVQFIITWVQTCVNPVAPFYRCERGIRGGDKPPQNLQLYTALGFVSVYFC